MPQDHRGTRLPDHLPTPMPYSSSMGLRATGCDVTISGFAPRRCSIFPSSILKQDGGVMVTASHNPDEYNGFKALSWAGLGARHRIPGDPGHHRQKAFADGAGTLCNADVITPYQAYVTENITMPKPLEGGGRCRQRHGRRGGGAHHAQPTAARCTISTATWTAPFPTTRPTPRCSKTCRS